MKLNIISALAILFFMIPTMADVNIEWGNGKLSITDLSGDEDLSEGLKVLQTEILIKDELSNKILSSSVKKKTIPFNQKKESLEDLKSKISNTISKHIGAAKVNNSQSKADINTNDDNDTFQVFNTKGFVVVNKGDEVEVAEGDIVDTLIVTGGSVKINGEVNNLVLIKGSVNVGAKGKISNKITELSGTLQVDQGGFVTENKSGLLDNFNFSGDLSKISNVNLSGLKMIVVITRLIQVLFLFWLGFRVVPYIGEGLFNQKVNWPYEGFVGMIHYCVMPFIMLVLTATVVGLSIVPIYGFLFYIMGLLGYGLISALLGFKIIEKIMGAEANKSKYLYLLIGFIVFESLMLLPFVGNLILLVLMTVSVGYVTSLVIKRKQI